MDQTISQIIDYGMPTGQRHDQENNPQLGVEQADRGPVDWEINIEEVDQARIEVSM